MTKISHDSETPARGQQVITVAAFIHAKFDGIKKVFLPKRAKTKKFLPDVFELPGGHVDFGEDIVEGLKREILEELEMHVSVGSPFAAFTYANQIKQSHSIEVIYFAEFVEPVGNVRLHPEDHSECGWFSEEEIYTKVASEKKSVDDPEYQAILQGFALLKGKSLKFS